MTQETSSFIIHGCTPAQVPRLAAALQEAGIDFKPDRQQVLEAPQTRATAMPAYLSERAAGLNELLEAMSRAHRLRTDTENITAAARQALYNYFQEGVEWDQYHPSLPMRHEEGSLNRLLKDYPELHLSPRRRDGCLRWTFTTETEAQIHRIQAALQELGADFDHQQDQTGMVEDILGYAAGEHGPRLIQKIGDRLADIRDMSAFPIKQYDELNFRERQRLLDAAAGITTWAEEQDLRGQPHQLVRELAEAAAGNPTSLQVQLMFEAAPRLETEDAADAEEMARRSHRCIYSWQTVGRSNWLEKGFHAADTLQLVVLPAGLPDHMDLPDDPPEASDDHDEGQDNAQKGDST